MDLQTILFGTHPIETIILSVILGFFCIELYLWGRATDLLIRDPNSSPYVPFLIKFEVYRQFGRIAKERKYAELSDTEQKQIKAEAMIHLQKNGLPNSKDRVMTLIQQNEVYWNCIKRNKTKGGRYE